MLWGQDKHHLKFGAKSRDRTSVFRASTECEHQPHQLREFGRGSRIQTYDLLLNKGMKYFTVYKTTNNINGKYYIGCHKTYELHDGYLGSGKLIKKAIEKYGVESFSKTILHVYDTEEEMYQRERDIVTESFCLSDKTYNLKTGGEGSWSHINTSPMKDSHRKAISNGLKERYKEENHPWEKSQSKPTFGMLGKSHSKKSKELISENNKNKLDRLVIVSRLEDLKNIPKNRGYIKILSEKWGVSHTQATRFIKKWSEASESNRVFPAPKAGGLPSSSPQI